MDAELRTNSDTNALALREITFFESGSGGSCRLEIKAGPFSATWKFVFDFPPLGEFISKLASLEQTLTGEARLGLQYEEGHISFRGSGLGHVTVSGLLVQYGGHTQKLQFSFSTDQTALAPFIRGLQDALESEQAGTRGR
jgi:hypothetical protein